MDASCLFSLLLGTNWVLFIWNYYLHYRQYRVHLVNEKRPKHVEALISEEDYEKARSYKLDKHTLSFAHDLYGQVWTTVVLLFGWLPWLWYTCQPYPLPSVVFLVVNSLVDAIIDLPWDMYDTFVIEEKHGFNKQTVGFYMWDKLKKMAVSMALMAPVVLVVEWIVENGGPYFFVYVWVFLSVVLLLLMTIYPAFIAPLFDKYIPLPDGKLKVAIEELAASLEFPLTKLYVVYGSKRSAHSNAYMYGFWNNKRIVLYDTLLSGEEKEKVIEICAEAAADMTEKDKDNLVPPVDDPLYSMCNHSHPPVPERIAAINKMK
ncbi:peptidase, M48 family, partial [Teladorsagia circumcincta]